MSEPLTKEQEFAMRANTTVGDEVIVHGAGVLAWRSVWATLDAARTALAESQRAHAEAEMDWSTALHKAERRVEKLTAWVAEVLPFVEGGASLKESEMYARWRITTAAAGRAALAATSGPERET